MERRLVAWLTGLALCAPVATAAGSDFDDPVRVPGDNEQQFSSGGNPQRLDTPNDPDYDQAELPGPTTTNLYDERFDLFGFPSRHTELTALYNDPQDLVRFGKPQVSGFNAAGAWKVTRGRPEVAVAILDTGIRWNTAGLRTKVRLNDAELPDVPLGANGILDVDDFVGRTELDGKTAPTGQDIIHAFEDKTDDDGNGFVDDIAGWDFFDDDNDPDDSSSYFAAANHGTGRAREAVERGNDGDGSIGVCPKCQFIPLRIWDTFVADGNGFAFGMVYATDNGASVIEGADGSLYHSAFAEAASQYAYDHGVVQTYSGDDLNTANHNYPANYSHAMLVEGTVADTYGLGEDIVDPLEKQGFDRARELAGLLPVGTQLPVKTHFRGAGTTQFGGKSSISMIGATGSENTGKASGAAAMVISAARGAGITLRPDETREILEQTAEDVLPLNTLGAGVPDPAQKGWDSHFGWGRVNLGRAVAVAASGKIPPEAAIHTPDWYAPLTGDAVKITGLAQSRLSPGGAFHWKLEYGLGQAPADGSWVTVREADAAGTVTDFGAISLAEVRAALAAHVTPPDTGGPVMNPLNDPFKHEFTVRVTVSAAGVIDGVDRRVLNALDDAALRPGFPKRMGTGGEAAIRYADIDGDGGDELIVPLEDGVMHAYRPDGGELPGWPVKTRLMAQAANHPNSPAIKALSASAPAREPFRAPLIADLDGDGVVEIVATAGRHVYAWEPDGSERPGFPVSVDLSLCRPQDQYQERDDGAVPGSHRKCGFLAGPAAARLDGQDKPPSIVVPALDGHVYAIDDDGTIRPGFPKELVDPAFTGLAQMKAEAINQPAIGDLNGDGIDDIVVPSNETYGATTPDGIDDTAGLFAHGLSLLLANAAGGSNRVYALDGKTGAFLPGWPIKVNGAIQTTLPFIGPGHDPSIAVIGGEPRVIASATGSADIGIYSKDGTLLRSMQQGVYSPASDAVIREGMINLFESAIVGDITGLGTRSVVKYGLGISQAANLLLVGQNVPYHHLIGAWDAADGKPMPAYPRVTEDYQFLSSSTIAKVDATSPANQVLAGTALGLLHAFDGIAGADVPGFPKYTGGWLYSPGAVSTDGRVAAITREGFLYEWAHAAVAACQDRDNWPAFRHDQQVTGNLEKDGTPPRRMTGASIEHVSGNTWTVRFTAPGDDGGCGTPAAYLARVGGTAVDLGAPAAPGTQVTRQVTLPAESGTLVIQARDGAFNFGAPAGLPFQRPTPPPPPEGGGNGDGGGATGGGTTTTTGGGTTTTTGGSTTTSPGTQALGNPPVTPRPGPCVDASAPRSSFYGWAKRVSRRGLLLRGRSTDSGCGAKLKKLFVAVNIATRGGRTCRALRASGRFTTPRSCHRTIYLRATGTKSWRFRFSGRLPRGKYTVWVRGVDAAGNIERKQASRNRLRFRIR
jgi:hypothetical protein